MTKAKPLPPFTLVRELFDYDKATGNFHRLRSSGGMLKGTKAGSLLIGKNTYIRLRIEDKDYLAHRIAWLFVTGQDPLEFLVDHIDGNGCNNAIANLRLATNAQNSQNQKCNKTNISGYKGVSFKQNNWEASIWAHGKRRWLGCFPTPELAHMAYCKAAAELHGDFARGA